MSDLGLLYDNQWFLLIVFACRKSLYVLPDALTLFTDISFLKESIDIIKNLRHESNNRQ